MQNCDITQKRHWIDGVLNAENEAYAYLVRGWHYQMMMQNWESSRSVPGLETVLLLEPEHWFSPVYNYTGPTAGHPSRYSHEFLAQQINWPQLGLILFSAFNDNWQLIMLHLTGYGSFASWSGGRIFRRPTEGESPGHSLGIWEDKECEDNHCYGPYSRHSSSNRSSGVPCFFLF